MSRGYRNNNPGNLIKSQTKFVGEIPGTDSRFRTFISMPWGFRALFKLLQVYISRGDNTLKKIFYKYAPPNENKTDLYIQFVADKIKKNPEEVISKTDKETLIAIAIAIATMENGTPPVFSDVLKGWDLQKVFKVPENEIPATPPAPQEEPKKKPNLFPVILGGVLLLGTLLIYQTYERKKIFA